jgi:hypothetical protein
MSDSPAIGCSAEALRDRESALAEFNRRERWLAGPRLDSRDAVAGIAWLYELLPIEARRRDPEVSGIRELRRVLALLPADSSR